MTVRNWRAMTLLATAAATAAGCGGGEVVCGPDSPQALMACVEEERYVADLEFIAKERVPGSAHWQAVQDLCRDRLTELGYEVSLDPYATGVNVIGTKLGSTLPDQQVLLTAHYDHIADCPGANDNASGMAGLLEAARVLAQSETERTLIVACWDEEERGMVGSRDYADRAAARGDDIIIVYNLEMIGYKSDEPFSQNVPDGFDMFFLIFKDEADKYYENEERADFLFWIADELAPYEAGLLATYGAEIGLPTIGGALPKGLTDTDLVADVRRSDHAPFWDHKIPAVMLTDTSEFRYPQYHCRNGLDVVDNLVHSFSAQIVTATVGASAEVLGLR
jgi:Zn-dependent M28 family amino/carboxypeptidase